MRSYVARCAGFAFTAIVTHSLRSHPITRKSKKPRVMGTPAVGYQYDRQLRWL